MATTSDSAAGPLKLDLRALASQARPGAPEWIEVRLDSNSVQLLEGVLELRVFDDSALAFTQRTAELALARGPRVFRLLLPASPHPERASEREVRARFLMRDAELELGKFPLHTRGSAAHSLVLGVARAPFRGGGESAGRLWQSLRPERFAPSTAPVSLSEILSTSPVMIDPEELPADPLVFCAFDALLLEAGVFAQIKEKPLAALGQWLTSGGSIAIVAADPLPLVQAEALRSWVQSDPAAPALEVNTDGRVQAKNPGLLLARVGLGRLAVFPDVPEKEDGLDTPEWRRAVAFLWKFRADHSRAIEQGGHWNTPTPPKELWRNSAYERGQLLQELTQALLPKTVRVIPLPVIVAILAAFIITVGPLDYFVLGKLRRRRLTWVVFPLVSIAFTALTVKLASHYLGTNTHHGAFILTDLAPDGRVVRETRFELVLPARPQELARETQHAFAAPLDSAAHGPDVSAGPPAFEGQFPVRYTFRTPIQQWTPHLLRITSLAPRDDDSRVNWGAVGGGMSDLPELARRLEADSGCSFVIVRGGNVAAGAPGQFSSETLRRLTSGTVVDLRSPGELSTEMLGRLTHSPQSALSPLFSQLSPTGSASLDDLAMMESGASERDVVIATRREGANIRVWRRVFLQH